MEINYCCIQHWSGWLGGVGNMGDDPMFANARGKNCRLLAGSPCIDTGDSLASGLSGTDIDGNPRVVGPAVDMGAYEFQDTLQHTAAASTMQLVDEVEALNFSTGIEDSFISKLENTIHLMQIGQVNAAINILEGFINEVEAQRGQMIQDDEADDLIAAAQLIIDLITNN
jgi:hypothetical protein